jgi:hypothetical protein
MELSDTKRDEVSPAMPMFMEELEQRTMLSSGPIVITSGGTYTGDWVSTNPNQAAVTIDTNQPVTIINSTIEGQGNLIATGTNGANITVKNTTGIADDPSQAGKGPGQFLNAVNASNIDLEHNTIKNAGAYVININGWTGSSGTVKILYNDIENVDGRYSNGSGGYEDAGASYAHAIILDGVQNVSGVQISWNQIVNQPGQSYANDLINIYNSSGTSGSPIQISNNYIDGLYALNVGSDSDSGTAIITDGTGSDAYIKIFSNVIVNAGNAGIGIASGHDEQAYDNTVLTSGYTSSGTQIFSTNVGIYVWNQAGGNFSNDGAYNNVIGYYQAPHTGNNSTGSLRENNVKTTRTSSVTIRR